MGRKNYLIDTNVAIYYFGLVLSPDSASFIDDLLRKEYFVSVINRIELLGCESLNIKEYAALEAYVDGAVIFELEEAIIQETIRLRRHYKIKLPDAIIAATCLVNDCWLITNNTKDFNKIEGIQIRTMDLV